MAELKAGNEYYHQGDIFIYVEDVKGLEGYCVVDEGGDYGYPRVVRKSELIPKEESWQWQQKQKYADELRLLTAKVQENLDEVAEKVVDKALKSLASRIKFNTLFGENSNMAWAGLVTDELTKLIRESGDKIAKKEKIEL